MSIGIPGDASAAVVMGELLAFGLQPGPKLLSDHGLISYTFICSLFIANLFMLTIGFYMMRLTGRLLLVPKRYITPTVMVLSVIGAYSINSSLLDVEVMIGCGVLAFALQYLDIHPGTVALGLILAPTAEAGLAQSMLIAQAKGSLFWVLCGQPMSIVLIALILLAVATSISMNRRRAVLPVPVEAEQSLSAG
jgi:putative tricarboxylic transport membrane protein